MKRTAVLIIMIVFCITGFAYAMWSGGPGGTWPESWPKELEPLREQAWTWDGGLAVGTKYEIPFTNREKFEAAWPHILELKSKGASLTILGGTHFFAKSVKKNARVTILPPHKGINSGPRSYTRIVMVVDGTIIDLNRIPLPADTPIIDERFKSKHKKSVTDTKPVANTNPVADTRPATE